MKLSEIKKMGAGRFVNSLNRCADNGFIALINHLTTH